METVNAAVRAQMDRLGHVSTLYPTLPIVELAEKLCNLSPGKLRKAFFTASGTEADETAVALAMMHTGSTELIALRHGYSGRSLLAQSLVGHAKYRVVPTQIAGIKHAAAPYCYRCPLGLKYPSCEVKCAQDIEDLIQTTTTGHIAGFLAEPIMGVGGFITAPDGYFKVAFDIIKKYGGVFISDEVQTGFGRTGNKMWGIEHHDGVTPDIMTMAKGIANGFPHRGDHRDGSHRRLMEGGTSPPSAGTRSAPRRRARRSTPSSIRTSPRTPPPWGRSSARGSTV